MTQRNGLQKTLREKRSGGKRERNRAWHSDGRRRMTCMDAIRGKSSILFHANLANNCCIHVHQCFAPQSSWKFPQLYRFQSAMSFVSGQPQNLDIVPKIFLPPYRDSSRCRRRRRRRGMDYSQKEGSCTSSSSFPLLIL